MSYMRINDPRLGKDKDYGTMGNYAKALSDYYRRIGGADAEGFEYDPYKNYGNYNWNKYIGDHGAMIEAMGKTQGFQDDLERQYNDYIRGKRDARYNPMLQDAEDTFNSSKIQQLYDIAKGNLSRIQGQAVAGAGRLAGTHAGGMSYANPSAFIMAQMSKAQQPYVQQYGKMEEGRVEAEQGMREKLLNFKWLVERAKQGDEQARQQLQLAYEQLAERRRLLDEQMEAQETDFWDVLSGLFGVGAKVLGIPAVGDAIFGSKDDKKTG